MKIEIDTGADDFITIKEMPKGAVGMYCYANYHILVMKGNMGEAIGINIDNTQDVRYWEPHAGTERNLTLLPEGTKITLTV